MKKLLLIIAAFFILNISFGQEIQFGVKGGVNLATVKYLNEDNSRARIGWNAGAIVELPVQEDLFIRPEIGYSSKGFGYSATGTGRAGSVRLNYVAVPVLAGYRANKNLSFLAGPEFGFLQKAASISQGISSNITNSFRKFDVGVDVGVTYSLNRYTGLDLRYNYGFKDLVNVGYTDANDNLIGQGRTGANRVFQIGIYYWLSQ